MDCSLYDLMCTRLEDLTFFTILLTQSEVGKPCVSLTLGAQLLQGRVVKKLEKTYRAIFPYSSPLQRAAAHKRRPYSSPSLPDRNLYYSSASAYSLLGKRPLILQYCL